MNSLNARSLLGLAAQGNQSLQSLSGLYALAPSSWIAVRKRFDLFHRNLSLTALQQQDAKTKRAGVVGCLNRHYYGTSSTIDSSFVIGSWAKGTAIRPSRDIDLYFLPPISVYRRFQDCIWNRQSALLQELKNVISETYPDTDMRGDGQVVVVHFETCNVEVAPAFPLSNGRYLICNTHDGGSYKETVRAG